MLVAPPVPTGEVDFAAVHKKHWALSVNGFDADTYDREEGESRQPAEWLR